MLRSFFLNKKWFWWAWGGGFFLLLSLLIQVTITVKINEWYKGFYDVLQKPTENDISIFWDKIFEFIYLALPYVVLATFTAYFTRLYAFRWREAMTFDYIPLWSSGTAKVEGSAQRIQEDTMRFAKIVESLGLQIVRAIMTLIAFTPILWGLVRKS
jgi:peptide/bleomycin uptake transporter